MSGKKAGAESNKPTTAVSNDPQDLRGALRSIGGSPSDSWNNVLANQAVDTLWLKNSDKEARAKQYSAAVAAPVSGKARCRMHGGAAGSGAPTGNKNALRHGHYTAEAIARRRGLAELIRQSRATLAELDKRG